MEVWEAFAVRQRGRYTPLPYRGIHDLLPTAMGYRLRLSEIVGLQMGQVAEAMAKRGSQIELRVSVSLFDEATGSFFGNTCSSLPSMPVPESSAEGLAETPVTLSLQQVRRKNQYDWETAASTRTLICRLLRRTAKTVGRRRLDTCLVLRWSPGMGDFCLGR